MQTHTKCEEKNGGEKVDDGVDFDIDSPKNLGLGYVIRYVEAIISNISRTTDGTPPHPQAREINANGAAFQSTKNGDVICVTELNTRRTTTCNEDFCEEGCDYYGDIGPFFYAVEDEEVL